MQVGGQALAQAAVERAERLVEQQQPRLDGQRPGQRHPLALPSRQRAGQPPGVPLEADEVEQLGDPGAAGGPGHLAQPERVGDVGGHVEVLEELAVLEHQCEPAAVGRDAGEVAAVEGHRPRGRALQAGDRAQQGGLAAARRAEDGHHRAGGHAQHHVLDRDRVAEPHGQVRDLEPHQKAPTEPTRSRWTASMTTVVVAASSTEAAMAIPKFSAPGWPISR